MTINLQKPDITELKPRITVFGVGGGGGNAVNNMITAGLNGVEFVVANTDAQALTTSKADRIVQLGAAVTEGLGAGSQPEVGQAAAEECIDEIMDHLSTTHMCFVTAGMGGGTGTGGAPVVARAAREKGILTVGVVTKPFHFEGQRRMKIADAGIEELQKCVDTLIVIPNQNLFRIANDKTTFADAFAMADQVLYSGVACITDLMVKEGLINLDFADVRSVMREMGKAMMGTGEASGEGRAMAAAEAAIANPLLDETSMRGARGLLISITGGRDLTLFEVDEAATRIREEVDPEANIILGATFDEDLEGVIRVSVVATGIDKSAMEISAPPSAIRQPQRAEQPQQPQQQKPAAGLESPAPAHQPAPAREAPVQQEPAANADNEPASTTPRAVTPGGSDQGFRPQSKLFKQEVPQPADPRPRHAAPQPAVAQQAAAAQQMAAPVQQPEPGYADPAQQADAQPTQQASEQPRMPRVEDFPPMVQAEINAGADRQAANQDHEERGPMGLLKRLTNGLSRREEEGYSSAQPPEPKLRQADTRRPSSESQLYAPRRGQLDEHGRVSESPRASQEDDHLEIPAFLRRQAN